MKQIKIKTKKNECVLLSIFITEMPDILVDTNVSFENTEVAFKSLSDKDLKKANLLFTVVQHPFISAIATGAVKACLALRLPINSIIRNTIFSHFCGGETINKSMEVIKRLESFHVRAILDYSVEGGTVEASFDQTKDEILKTIEKAKSTPSIPFCVFKMTGMASTPLLEKINRGDALTSEETEAFQRIRKRVEEICDAGAKAGIKVMIDAEETWIQKPIDQLAYEMMQKYNSSEPIVYNTYQMYCVESYENLKKAFHYAAMHNYYLGAKLVRGAYMEKERERAEDKEYPSPIHPNKQATDEAFNKAINFCLDNKQRIGMVCGSHNEYSNHFLTKLMERHSLPPNHDRVWFAQLYGMSDNISFNLAKAGYNVVKYLPYGPIRSVMPYLFRRAKENTSVAGQSSRELMLIRKELKRRNKAKGN